MAQTIQQLVRQFFTEHPCQAFAHSAVVDWVTEQWLKEHPTPPRDPWRCIRRLHQEGFLIKVRKGVYLHDPQRINSRELEDFSAAQKEEIFKRDNYRCVICGKGIKDGVEIHADHIIPKDLGGKAEVANGQTLCSQHNLQKKNYKQTETGKKMFIRLYELAKQHSDERMLQFCSDILKTFEQYHINDHVEWKH